MDMSEREFVDLVARMRAAQRGYFRERTQERLEASKALEREVDREVARRQQEPGARQGDMFAATPPGSS
jgi:hypothetical protein